MDYLETPIVDIKLTARPLWGTTAMGYTHRSGAPTSYMVKLKDEKRWRRLMVWQFSNAGTLFLRIAKKTLIVSESSLPEVK